MKTPILVLGAFHALVLGLLVAAAPSQPPAAAADAENHAPIAPSEYRSVDAIFQGVENSLQNDARYRADGDNRYLVSSLAETLQRQASGGDRDAQFKLGAMCLEGVGVRPNLDEAIRWFTQAGGADHPLTQLAYGRLYLKCRDDDARRINVREEAIEALGKIGPAAEPAIPLLERELDRDWPMGFHAAEALGRIGGRGVAILIKALASKDVGVRRAAASGLAAAPENAGPATSQLTAALHDEDQQVREFAQRALKRLEMRKAREARP
ncbi:MAG TPA: HEAT repeat domain-containing protein [Pirellulales bacterium]